MNTTKKVSLLTSIIVGGLITLGTASAASITTTKHNLGTSGTGTNHMTGATDATQAGEVCVFCHTPHGSDTGASVPLWNRNISGMGAFNTYDSLGTSTLDGGIAKVGSVSIACLSCHDGVQAMDVMINQPGSGGYNASGAAIAGGTWAGANVISGIAAIGDGGAADLTNDHPIGIQYAGGGISESGNASVGSGADADFKAPAFSMINTKPVWWVDTAAVGTREKTDLPLYTRNVATADWKNGDSGQQNEPFVECASCHDPHVADNPTFLRISNAGSAVCLACHVK